MLVNRESHLPAKSMAPGFTDSDQRATTFPLRQAEGVGKALGCARPIGAVRRLVHLEWERRPLLRACSLALRCCSMARALFFLLKCTNALSQFGVRNFHLRVERQRAGDETMLIIRQGSGEVWPAGGRVHG